jgi:hypothetical protein
MTLSLLRKRDLGTLRQYVRGVLRRSE